MNKFKITESKLSSNIFYIDLDSSIVRSEFETFVSSYCVYNKRTILSSEYVMSAKEGYTKEIVIEAINKYLS